MAKQFTKTKMAKWATRLEFIGDDIQDVFDRKEMTQEEAKGEVGTLMTACRDIIDEAINIIEEAYDI